MAECDTYSDIEEDTDNLTLTFLKATEHVKKLVANLQPQKLLEFYSFYKQATVGPCNQPKPRFYEIQAKAKWDAWNKLETMSSDEAKKEYIRIMSELDPNFETERNESWVTVSSLVNTDEILNENDKTVFDFCKEDNLRQLRLSIIKNSNLLNSKDENGLGLIHWAADRGNLDILKFLINSNIDINMIDLEGQTALHYASSCDYFSCVEFLIHSGSDCNLENSDGLKPVDLATDAKILKLFKK